MMIVGKMNLDIKKSTGRMLVLMLGTGLPLRRYRRHSAEVYTLEPFGPQDDFPYDWHGSSPVKFTPRHVEIAMSAGVLAPHPTIPETLVLTEFGSEVAKLCEHDFGPVVDEHFAGRGVDWHDAREWI